MKNRSPAPGLRGRRPEAVLGQPRGLSLAEWHGFAKGDRLRNPGNACVYASRERRSICWLADISDFSVVDLDDQRWIVETFYPLLAENGLRHMSVVMPVRAVAELSARRVNTAYGERGSIEFEYHATRSAASRWLSTKVGALRTGDEPEEPE